MTIKLSNNNPIYKFHLQNMKNHLSGLTEEERIKEGDKFFRLTEAMAILWCTSLDNVVNDYLLLVEGE